MSKSDEWETPPELFELICARQHGGFLLDAAATVANRKAPKHLTDGLNMPWAAFTWCNPPYSQLPQWTAKARAEAERGHPSTLLIPAYTDTGWWQDNVLGASTITFLTGRVTFWEDGKPGKWTARFPSVVVEFNPQNLFNPREPLVSWWDWKREWKSRLANQTA